MPTIAELTRKYGNIEAEPAPAVARSRLTEIAEKYATPVAEAVAPVPRATRLQELAQRYGGEAAAPAPPAALTTEYEPRPIPMPAAGTPAARTTTSQPGTGGRAPSQPSDFATTRPTTAAEAFGQGVMETALPTATGVALGAAAGTTVAPGPGTVALGLVGGVLGAMGMGIAQDKILKRALGEDVYRSYQQQRARARAEHPYASFAGEVAPSLTMFRPSMSQTKSIVSFIKDLSKTKNWAAVAGRNPEGYQGIISMAFGAGTDVANEALAQWQTGKFDAGRLALSVLSGVATQKATKLGELIAPNMRAALKDAPETVKAKDVEPVIEPPAGMKEHRTVTRAAEVATEKPLATEARKTGEAFYPPRNIASEQSLLKAKNDTELEVMATNKEDVNRGLAFQERLERAATEPERQAVFDKMVKDAGDAGYVLRTYAEYLKATPEGALATVNRTIKRAGAAPMTPAQEAAIKPLAEANIKARKAANLAEAHYRTNPSAITLEALTKARLEYEGTNRGFMQKAGEYMPKSVADTVFKIIQGRLLAPISHVYNFTGNVVNQPLRALVDVVATPIDMIRATVQGKPRLVYNPTVGLGTKIKAMGKATRESWRLLKEGGGRAYGEIEMTSHPAKLWLDTIRGQGPKPPENLTTRQKFAWSISTAMEGLSPDAEINFRLLAAMDAPFSRGEYAKALHQIGLSKGLKGAELEVFKNAPDRMAREQAENRALEAVYQSDNFINGLATYINRGMRKAGGPWGELVGRLATGLVFTKTPANLATEYMQLGFPPLAFARAATQARAGNVRGAELAAARGIVGTVLLTAFYQLAKAGIIMGNKKGKEKQLGYETQPPMTMNVSAAKRMWDGGDPSWRPGDKVVNLGALGFVGLMMSQMADTQEDIEKYATEQGIAPEDVSLVKDIMPSTGKNAASAFVQGLSMLKGQQVIYDSIAKENYGKWIENIWNLVTTLAIPNTLATAARAKDDFVRSTKGTSTSDTMLNIVQNKIPGWREGLTPRLNMWGEPIRTTPEDRTPVVYQFIDATKTREIPDRQESVAIWNVVHEAVDPADKTRAIPPQPGGMSGKITVNGRGRPLTMEEHNYLEEIVGQDRLARVRNLTRQSGWNDRPAKVRSEQLGRVYDDTLKVGVSKLLQRYPEIKTRTRL